MRGIKIWVVLPAFNEADALPLLLDALIEHLEDLSSDFSIIVVNDGSKDQTGEIAEQYARKGKVLPIHNEQNVGLAETLKRGLMAAVEKAGERDIILTMDADNTQPAGLARRMIRVILEGNDVAIASRYREGSRVRGVPLPRILLSYGSSILFRTFFPTPGVRDFTSGYRAYRAAVLKRLIDRHGNEFISERGFSCMVDILLRLRALDVVMTEVPLVLRYDQKPGQTKMKVMQTVFDTLRLLVRRRLGAT
jgi:dolichol-phosphate mannosyltransferase